MTTTANNNMEQAIKLAERECNCGSVRHMLAAGWHDMRCPRYDPNGPASVPSLRSFTEIQREWLDACRDSLEPLSLELAVLGNRLILEAHLSGQAEAYGKVAGGRK